MKPKNPYFVAIGRQGGRNGKGIPKNFSAEEIEKRRARLILARAKKQQKETK